MLSGVFKPLLQRLRIILAVTRPRLQTRQPQPMQQVIHAWQTVRHGKLLREDALCIATAQCADAVGSGMLGAFRATTSSR